MASFFRIAHPRGRFVASRCFQAVLAPRVLRMSHIAIQIGGVGGNLTDKIYFDGDGTVSSPVYSRRISARCRASLEIPRERWSEIARRPRHPEGTPEGSCLEVPCKIHPSRVWRNGVMTRKRLTRT